MTILKINNKLFKTKTALKKYTQEILYANKIQKRFTSTFIDELIKWHPKYIEKVGTGVKEYFIDMVPPYNKHPGLYIVRKDNTISNISWNKCIRIPTRIEEVNRAARGEIRQQICDFRKTLPIQTKCHITDVTIINGDLHVDHEIPFKTLFSNWCNEFGIIPESIETYNKEGRADSYFKQKILSGLWQMYHKKHAILRPTSSIANLTRK